MKRISFKTFDYAPSDRKRVFMTILEKPYIHKNFQLQPHKYHRWYNMYKNPQTGETHVYFNPHKFPHFSTICTTLGTSSLQEFPDAIIKLLNLKEQSKKLRRTWRKTHVEPLIATKS